MDLRPRTQRIQINKRMMSSRNVFWIRFMVPSKIVSNLEDVIIVNFISGSNGLI